MNALLIDVAKIPTEGMELAAPLEPSALHLEGERGFLLEGGSLRARIERGDDESVHVRGRLEAPLRLECGRCLDPFRLAMDQELELFFLPHVPDQVEEEDEVELSDRDMVVGYYQHHRLDLGEALREQIILGLPPKPLCREDCAGLCRACGANRNATRCECRVEEPADPRLAVLRRLFDKE